MNDANLLGDPVKLARRLIETGTEWAQAVHAAAILEETKSTLLAKLTKEHASKEMPMNKAEMMAKADPRYEQHIRAMVDAQRDAALARVRYDAGRAFIDLARSAESTRRAEMGLR